MIWTLVGIAVALLGGVALVRWGMRWGMRWGSTTEERARQMPGDEYLEGGPRSRIVMTRAVSLSAPPERVWPWIAQLGRGAGWYSVDWLDNGRKSSAWHIVSWIPEPQLGDATAIGYIRHLDPGRSVVWWLDGTRFVGAEARLLTCIDINAEGQGTRLVIRISSDAAGRTARLALLVLRVIDSIMACRQLVSLRKRIEDWDEDASPQDPETGDRDQYQLYEILYAGGEQAGVAGKEEAAKWHAAAIRDGVLEAPG